MYQAMALPSGFRTTLSNSIGIRLVLLALVVMPTNELVLPFDIGGHWSALNSCLNAVNARTSLKLGLANYLDGKDKLSIFLGTEVN